MRSGFSTLRIATVLAVGTVSMLLHSTYGQQWLKRYLMDDASRGVSIRQMSDGGFVFASKADPSSDAIFLARVDAWGSPLWGVKWLNLDEAKVAVTSDDRIYAALGRVPMDLIRLLHLDADGNVLWERHMSPPSAPWEVATLPNDDLVVAVGGQLVPTGEPMVARLDPSGSTVWDVTWTVAECEPILGGCITRVRDIIVRPDGNMVIAAHLVSSVFTVWGVVLLELDGNGNYVGHVAYDLGTFNYSTVDVRDTSDGGFVLVVSVPQTFVLRFDAEGTPVWVRRINKDIGASQIINDMETDSGDGIVLASVGDSPPWVDPELRKIGPGGDLAWDEGFICGGMPQSSALYGLTTTDDGRIAATGACGAWTLIAVVDEAGEVGTGCNTIAPGFSTYDPETTVTPLNITVSVQPFDHSDSSSPIVPEPVAVTVVAECSGPPTEASPPGAVQALVFTDPTTLMWDEAANSGSSTFNVYRGALDGAASGNYGSCLDPDVPTNSTSDPVSPPSGIGWIYLVAGVNAAGEGPLGFDSAGGERSHGAPCM